MNAVLGGNDESSQTKDKWAEIKKKTADDYYNGFMKYVKSKQ